MRFYSCFPFIIILFLSFNSLPSATFYVDGDRGSDTNSGTLDMPFATIQKAAEKMQAGDVCLIRQGLYREKVRPTASGTAGSPIRFQAYGNETVYITGTDPVPPNLWQVHEGSIYKADMADIGRVSQVFVDEQRMEIARFPNNSHDLMKPVWGTAKTAIARQKPALTQFTDPLLGQTGADFTDADIWLLTGRKWVAFSSRVASHSGETIEFVFPGEATNDAYKPQAGSTYFITGLLECLDVEREWFYDSRQRILYFHAPGGADPGALNVQVRTREWGFDAANRDYIEIENIHFFAAAVNFNLSEQCLLDGSKIFYPVPFYQADAWSSTETPQNARYNSIKLGGRYNTVKDCEVAYSWGEGIVVFGNDNRVENCLVHDIDWLCTDAAPIHTSGSGHVITNNTIYNAARSGLVHRKSTALEIAYNEIYDCGLLTTDLGATYCWSTDGRGTVIHHNWVHDVVTPAHTAGIYLDNNSSNFLVHHNVVWNTDDLGIQTNLDARNHEIYHNTIWNCSQAMGGSGGNQVMEDQRVYNNLSNSSAWFGTDVLGNLAHDDPKFVDPGEGDFRLQADSPARDDYYMIAKLLNGGFEAGAAGWTGAGCDLTSVDDPVHSGDFAAYAHNRDRYWEGARQTITEVLKDHGPGRYTIEAWVKLSAGTTKGYLRFKLVDDDGDDYPGTQRTCSADEWTKLSYATNLNWKGTLREAVFELMTTGGDELTPFYVDDCVLLTPEADTTRPRGGIMIAGINDDVVDGKPDAGAYEYGGTHADWRAGSSLSASKPNLPVRVGGRMDQVIDFSLQQNYPNPFNDRTVFFYTLQQSADVDLTIYNTLGEKITTLVKLKQPSGWFQVVWDGRNDENVRVASGVYIYQLQVRGNGRVFERSRKMVYIR